MNNLVKTLSIVLSGCSGFLEDSEFENSYPIETVKCTHQYSQGEATVAVEVEDNYAWKDIEFRIHQEENMWTTNLWDPESNVWHTHMQIINLSCLDEYHYDFYYIEKESE